MNRLNIKSVLNSSKICYVVEKDHDYSGLFKLLNGVKQYDTYGDSDCQHSPAYSAQASNVYDFLLSLLAFLAEPTNMTDNEVVEFLQWEIGHRMVNLTVKQAEFLKTVIHKESTPEKSFDRRYFSLEEMKVSSADSKRHDKRWFVIPDWANGDVNAIIGLYGLATDHRWQESLIGIMATRAVACEVCDQNWQFAEQKDIGDAFGDKADESHRLFVACRDLLKTYVEHKWQVARAQSWLKDAMKPVEQPAEQVA